MEAVHKGTAVGRCLGVFRVTVAWGSPVGDLSKHVDFDLINRNPRANPELLANSALCGGELKR